MAKQEKLNFDSEGFFNERFENTAVLMWSTHHPAFTFAFYLNQLYGISLVRRDDIVPQSGDSRRSMLYSYQSNADHLAYFLIEQPLQKKGDIFDKVLLVIGADAFPTAQHIYDETSQPIDASLPFAAAGHNLMLRSFIETGIFESALFDFSDPDRPETTYFPSSTNNAALEKKRAKFLKEQRERVSDLIIQLDPLLPDYDSE